MWTGKFKLGPICTGWMWILLIISSKLYNYYKCDVDVKIAFLKENFQKLKVTYC